MDKPFCTVSLGTRKLVFLNTHDAMREAWQKTGDAVTGRPKMVKLRSGGFGKFSSTKISVDRTVCERTRIKT
jgi:hypothetical protein